MNVHNTFLSRNHSSKKSPTVERAEDGFISESVLFDSISKNNAPMAGSLHIFITWFFVKGTKIPKLGCKIFISMCSVFAFARQDRQEENNKKSK